MGSMGNIMAYYCVRLSYIRTCWGASLAVPTDLSPQGTNCKHRIAAKDHVCSKLPNACATEGTSQLRRLDGVHAPRASHPFWEAWSSSGGNSAKLPGLHIASFDRGRATHTGNERGALRVQWITSNADG